MSCGPTINAKPRVAFTLAEILLGVALAAVVVLTLVALSLTALKGNRKAADLTMAQNLAHQFIEQEIYGAQQEATAAFWSQNSDQSPLVERELVVGDAAYQAALYVVDANSAATPGLKRCRVRLSWWGGEGDRAGYGRLFTEVVRFASRL